MGSAVPATGTARGSVAGAAGLLAEEHIFAIEQWNEARALFDEWSTQNGGHRSSID